VIVVVSDTSPLLNLAIIGRLELLPALYQEVAIPSAVYHELVVAGAGMPGADAIKDASWIRTKSARNESTVASLRLQLHSGEAEAIALGLELGADLMLIDERKARFIATKLGLKVIGLLGVLVEAKQKGYILAVKPLLEELVSEAKFRVSDELYQLVLRTVEER
jgi:hypothetical protein